MSNDGIKISVNIEHDHAEISARRFSASSVVVNDTIQLEYLWMTLINGDTLTFADGSRYVFYNIYNHRDIDEITLDGAIVRYVRRNMLDEENKPFGSVSVLVQETNFDAIDHSHDNDEISYDNSEMEEDLPVDSPVVVEELVPQLTPWERRRGFTTEKTWRAVWGSSMRRSGRMRRRCRRSC